MLAQRAIDSGSAASCGHRWCASLAGGSSGGEPVDQRCCVGELISRVVAKTCEPAATNTEAFMLRFDRLFLKSLIVALSLGCACPSLVSSSSTDRPACAEHGNEVLDILTDNMVHDMDTEKLSQMIALAFRGARRGRIGLREAEAIGEYRGDEVILSRRA